MLYTAVGVGLLLFLVQWARPVLLLVSMPITVMIVLLLRSDEQSRWIASLLTRDPGEPSDATA
jgi:hypothetical protein